MTLYGSDLLLLKDEDGMAERWYSVDEIATHLGIVRETVYRWIDRKGLPAHRIGKFWKFKIPEVDMWARSEPQQGESVEEGRPGPGPVVVGPAVTDPLLDHDPVLREIVVRLVDALHPARIYLFGSRARGNAGSDSDYDIVVLVERPAEPRYRLSQVGYRALRGVPAAVDVVVWDRGTFDARLHLEASFPATVVREGRVLHAA
jgi:excisionase family DNA binding protein